MAKFGERIKEIPVQRDKGYLYYIDKEGWPARSPMTHGRKKGKVKAEV